ncbi:hypothetical protein MP638_006086 [Amoeboaphelidium occidentale]|nr:hypothetical protein MP638_006086 [Amoeboaphelidium occidentale]
MFIQTESTPNEHALKFKPGVQVVPEGKVYEFSDLSEVKGSLLARELFAIKGVKSIFFAPTFVTVNKHESYQWAILKPEIYGTLMDYFSQGKPAVNEEAFSQESEDVSKDSEVVQMIKELLNTRIRPAVQEDGGDIEYVQFEDDTGVLKLKLKGSCRGCSSSSITLKSGIENMMKHYIPEVSRVEQVLDPVEEVSQKAFDEFEKQKS